jgi:hypothetical protein
MDATKSIGLEKVQRAVTLMMAENINNAIDEQNALWELKDQAFFDAMNQENPEFVVEYIAPDNFYSGTIPSLISAPRSSYPNLCVIAYIATPRMNTEDWGELYQLNLAIEIMVKSEKSEQEVNSRIQRTLEAAHIVLTSDKARRIPDEDGVGIVPQIAVNPTATIGDVFVRHEGVGEMSADPDARWFWQGGSLTYQIDKFMCY